METDPVIGCNLHHHEHKLKSKKNNNVRILLYSLYYQCDSTYFRNFHGKKKTDTTWLRSPGIPIFPRLHRLLSLTDHHPSKKTYIQYYFHRRLAPQPTIPQVQRFKARQHYKTASRVCTKKRLNKEKIKQKNHHNRHQRPSKHATWTRNPLHTLSTNHNLTRSHEDKWRKNAQQENGQEDV